jgi:hypothetical protein
MSIYIGLGTGWFGLVWPFWPPDLCPLDLVFSNLQYSMKLVKSPGIRVGWGGLCGQVGWVGHVGWVFLGAIIFNVLKFKFQIS